MSAWRARCIRKKAGQVIIQTLGGVLPGKGTGDMVEQAAQRTHDQGVTGGQLALWLGLLAAIIALTTAMGQIERGANRIYGIERDRPGAAKVRPGSADGLDRPACSYSSDSSSSSQATRW